MRHSASKARQSDPGETEDDEARQFVAVLRRLFAGLHRHERAMRMLIGH